jgi:hypothetical protein
MFEHNTFKKEMLAVQWWMLDEYCILLLGSFAILDFDNAGYEFSEFPRL